MARLDADGTPRALIAAARSGADDARELDALRVQGQPRDQRRLDVAALLAVVALELRERERLVPAVHRIDDEREADLAQVHADLVRAPRERLAPHERVAAEALLDRHARLRRLPAFLVDAHAAALALVRPDGQVDDLRLAVGQWILAFDQREVRLVHRARVERRAQLALGDDRLGHEHDTGRVLVEAMQQTRAELEALRRHERIGRVDIRALERQREQRSRQRRVAARPALGLRGQISRLVDGEHVLVLVQHRDLEGRRDRRLRCLLVLLEVDQDHLVPAQPMPRHRALSVEQDLALAHLPAQEALREQRERQAQELVELHAAALGRDR
jgi:hypothetical protein